MKSLRFVALLLVIASAMVLGCSAGLIAGLTDANIAAQQNPPSAASTPILDVQAQPHSASAAPVTPSHSSTAAEVGGKRDDNGYNPRDLSGSDIAQIENMLQALGYNTAGGIVPAVQKYQQDNNLNATGAIDINTLQLMINQIRLNRAQQLAGSKTS